MSLTVMTNPPLLVNVDVLHLGEVGKVSFTCQVKAADVRM